MAGLGARCVAILLKRVGTEAWILEPELNTAEITRRAQHVLPMPLALCGVRPCKLSVKGTDTWDSRQKCERAEKSWMLSACWLGLNTRLASLKLAALPLRNSICRSVDSECTFLS